MNRIDRLTAMILMLQSHRVVTAERIAEHFEISVRTVYRDIASLGEAGVPIMAEAGVGYALMRGYHVPPIMFTEDEAAALFMSGELTEQFGDESLKKALRGALLKVRAALPADRKDYLSRLSKTVRITDRFSDATVSADAGGDRSLMPVQESVVRRRCLRLQYNTGSLGKLTDRVVEPLGVVFYARRWHLVAWCRLREGIRDFRLDRMQEWEVLPETFQGHEDFSLMDFLDHEVDSEEFTPILMSCECRVLDRVLAEIPAQITKRFKPIDGRVQIEARAYSLDWIASWSLGLGIAAELHSPPELREKVANAARAVADGYEAKA